MKLLRNLFLAGACLTAVDSTPIDNLNVVGTLALFIPKSILAKTITGLALVSGHHISTMKVIWEGKIGQHKVHVTHDNRALVADRYNHNLLGFNFNPVNYQTAVKLWERNRPIFEKILPHINDTQPIEIRMCASDSWQVAPSIKFNKHIRISWHTIWIDSAIASDPREESEFLLAHEVGHLALKHTQSIPKTDKERRIREKQADIRAVKILNSADGGIAFFKKRAHHKDPFVRLQIALRDKFYGATTHPLYPERIRYLQHWKAIHERGK